MKIAMFFGSFNPIHIGHKVIASYLVDFTDLDKVMFVVSPQNPLKQKISLLDQYHRLQIIRAEVEGNPKLEVSDIEFSMPKPSYTIDTLVRLKEKYPDGVDCVLMMSCGPFDLDVGEEVFFSFAVKVFSDFKTKYSRPWYYDGCFLFYIFQEFYQANLLDVFGDYQYQYHIMILLHQLK